MANMMKLVILYALLTITLYADERIDCQKMVDNREWYFSEDDATPLGCVEQCGNKYTINLESTPRSFGRLLTIKVILGSAEIYRWEGHRHSVFRIVDDKLFYARFSEAAQGGTIVAVDLLTGLELWASVLKGHFPVIHSKYFNRLNIHATERVIEIFGREMIGDYLEVKDMATGETVAHRIFSSTLKRSSTHGCLTKGLDGFRS
jgi:hypothetical protein